MIIQVKCIMCKELTQIQIPESNWKRYIAGENIQDCLDFLSADLRELMISKTCGKCFDKLFASEEE